MATQILATVPSTSNPEITYDICKGKDEVIYCTCPGWRNQRLGGGHRTCKHLTSFHAGQLARKAPVETKAEAGQNLALAAKRVAARKKAHAAHKAIKAGDTAAALSVVSDPMMSGNLRRAATALLSK